mgnify:CR=1 FL=1
MNIPFPKYPFIWNYEDMYLPLEYNNQIITKDEVVEKIMGYTGVRKKATPIETVNTLIDEVKTVVTSLLAACVVVGVREGKKAIKEKVEIRFRNVVPVILYCISVVFTKRIECCKVVINQCHNACKTGKGNYVEKLALC